MPWERHDHFDADGNPTGYTIVSRESEWDDAQRERMQALVEYERGVHATCGLHDSIAKTDPYIALEDDVCPLCRAIELELRVRANREHEADEKAGPTNPHQGDGRSTYVRLVSPADSAVQKLRAGAQARR